MKKKNKKVVIGVIGTDCHIEGNKIIHKKLEENGFEVINVGILSPQEEFIHAALESSADAIIVSSLYGYGEMDCQNIRKNCEKYNMDNILLYVGGNVAPKNNNWKEVEKKFKDMGFNRVYKAGVTIEETIIDLKNDLGVL